MCPIINLLELNSLFTEYCSSQTVFAPSIACVFSFTVILVGFDLNP